MSSAAPAPAARTAAAAAVSVPPAPRATPGAELRSALLLFGVYTVLTGLLYPALVTLAAQAFFPAQAEGSVIAAGGIDVGSRLIGQPAASPRYFHGRPSATSRVPYDALASAGSNLGPTNPALLDAVAERVAALRAEDPDNAAPIPVDLVTASGSGLDPHISPAAAVWQAARVARARGLPVERVRDLVRAHTEGRSFGLLGEPRVNVLLLNLALDDTRR